MVFLPELAGPALVTLALVEASKDDRLVERIAAGDEAALAEVMSLHGSLVYGIALRVVAEPGLAQEVAQDTFLALWRNPSAYDAGRGSLRGWLAGVARNKAVDLVRREEVRRRAVDALLAEGRGPSGDPPAVEPTETMERRRDLIGALRQLPRPQMEALVLAYFGGRTYREVARELGIPEGTAKTRLREALGRLRRQLGESEGGR